MVKFKKGDRVLVETTVRSDDGSFVVNLDTTGDDCVLFARQRIRPWTPDPSRPIEVGDVVVCETWDCGNDKFKVLAIDENKAFLRALDCEWESHGVYGLNELTRVETKDED